MIGDVDELLPFASPRQAEFLHAIKKTGSTRAAAKAMGCDRRRVQDALLRVRKARAAVDASTRGGVVAPAGITYKGVSTLVRIAGSSETPVLQWRKDSAAAPDPAAYAEAVADALAALKGVKPRKAPRGCEPSLLTVIPVGDPHIGMRSWARETGADWDLKIAAQVHRDAFARLLSKAPKASTALIVFMGDNAHADNGTAMTPASGHHLDVDSRWSHMLEVLLAVMVNGVEQALVGHTHVIVRVVLGNHDPHVSAAMAVALQSHYRHEPRVTVAREPVPLFVRVWGETLLCFAHGHAPQPERVPDILAADYRKEIGDTKQGHLYTGHVHSKVLRERGGLTMESVPTLAAKDAYATHAGFRSSRGMYADTFDLHGQIERHMYVVRDQRVS
jgi:molybdenum-dependent DNA-binding transcriptional regulator ModE